MAWAESCVCVGGGGEGGIGHCDCNCIALLQLTGHMCYACYCRSSIMACLLVSSGDAAASTDAATMPAAHLRLCGVGQVRLVQQHDPALALVGRQQHASGAHGDLGAAGGEVRRNPVSRPRQSVWAGRTQRSWALKKTGGLSVLRRMAKKRTRGRYSNA